MKAVNDLHKLLAELMPKRQTINLKGTHFLKHQLHDLDPLKPTSYSYLEQKKRYAYTKPNSIQTSQTLDVHADISNNQLEPIVRQPDLNITRQSFPKSSIIKHITEEANAKLIQFGSGGHSNFVRTHREQQRKTLWRAPETAIRGPSFNTINADVERKSFSLGPLNNTAPDGFHRTNYTNSIQGGFDTNTTDMGDEILDHADGIHTSNNWKK